MKKSLRIARLELSLLFYSPIAWFLLIVLIVQTGLSYTGTMDIMERSREINNNFHFLTSSIFSNPYIGLFSSVLKQLYLYIPLITMGLMSREISSGTTKLLYSSPVLMWEIIFGKFMAMMVYSGCMVIVLGFFVIAGAVTIPHFDWPVMLSALLGVFLLLCAYSAIGLFMSCLTSYQVVAALSTFVVFAFLSFIGTVWQGVDFVRNLTYSLSIPGRTEKMVNGLISTKDVAYFLVIIYMFLGLAVMKLQAARESRSWLIRAGKYVAVVLSGLMVGYLTSRPGFIGYYDASATRVNTLSGNAQNVLGEMKDGPIEITCYSNLLDRTFGQTAPDKRNDFMNHWEPYLRFKPDIQFKYVYYYDSAQDPYLYKGLQGQNLRQIAEKRAKAWKMDLSFFTSPAEIRRIIDLRPEQNRYVMQVKYKGQRTFLRVFNDPIFWPSETETSAAFRRLTVKLPKIAFLEDGFERSIHKTGDREYQTLTDLPTFRYALVNQGFDVDTVSAGSRDIPSDITALVIADPKADLSSVALARIQKYIEGGGDLLIAGEPGKQAVLNPLLQQFGVRLMEGTVVQESKDFAADLVLPYLTPAASEFSKTLMRDYGDSLRVSMPGVAGLVMGDSGAAKDYIIRPLLMTDEKVSWNKKGRLVKDSAEVVYTPSEGDEKKALPTAVCLSRKVGGRQQRIIVTGDADFLSNSELGRSNVRTANFHFITALFGWFTEGQFPVDTSRPSSEDNHLRLSEKGMTMIKMVYLGVVPGVLFLMGAVLLVRRRRK